MKKLSLILALTFIIIISGCSAKKTSNQKIITTTVNTYVEPVKSIAGDKYKVESIIKSVNVDPHSFTTTINDAKNVSDSTLIVANGLGYDDWINKLIDSNNKSDNEINLASGVLKKKNGQNEHVWFGVNNVLKLSEAVKNQLSKRDPKNKDYYQSNYDKYSKKLGKLTTREADLKEITKGKKAYITEPLPYYLLRDLGISVENEHFAKAIEDDTDPSVEDIQNMEDGLRNGKVDFLIVNKQVSSSIVTKMTKIAKGNNIPVISFTETLPSDIGYYEWMNGNLNQIEKAVQK
ncbi:metal ABC transporter solute-binding protein, Zn/Mn family [Companilactobacillus metriopterae]|uniref:metal ABC transporter solute-binding protein, Zn/Mn family n=1 Tax=Companilactobacillus metriopterae TaxID=1909267 RepID=UPI00100B3188|nr:zinc ABC transporter substrate-binding protein [Companilactobacillus metriopterae]